jgi:hypothetical protein
MANMHFSRLRANPLAENIETLGGEYREECRWCSQYIHIYMCYTYGRSVVLKEIVLAGLISCS